MTFAIAPLVRKAWRQPQQLWLRKAFFQVHLWTGLVFALYVVAIGISGSILVYKDELMPRPNAGRIPFEPARCTPSRLIAALNSASKAHPKLVPSLALCPIEANNLYAITLHPSSDADPPPASLTVYVHPQTGRVIGEVNEQSTWINTIEQFHLDLLMRHNGRQWNGIGAAALLLLVLSGLVIWWPGIRNWRRAFKFDLERTWKRINWDLHSAVGIWTVFFTMVWGATGVYFAWPTPVERAINAISPIITANYPGKELARFVNRSPSQSKQTVELQPVFEEAQTLSPGEHFEGLFFGSGPNAMLTIYMARARLGDYTQTDFLYFDQQTGEHFLTWRRGQNKTLGDWILWLLVPLHFGTSWGALGKMAWCGIGLVLPLLAVTGLLMYWNRWLRKILHL